MCVSHSQAELVGYIPSNPSSDYSPFYVNDDGFRGDDLGEAVAMDGDWLLIGEPSTDGAMPASGTAWVQHWFEAGDLFNTPVDLGAMVPISIVSSGARFGNAVDIDGNYAVVGAPECNKDGISSGRAYVFEFDGVDWTFLAVLFDGSAGDTFGAAVDITGTHIAIGKPGANSGDGGIELYEITTGLNGSDVRWVESIHPPRNRFGGRFGESVDGDGTVLAVGAPLDIGWAIVYHQESDGTYTIESTLAPPSDLENIYSRFGASLAVSGDNILVGAPWPEASSSESPGAVVYTRNPDATWSEHTMLDVGSAGFHSQFGNAVALHDDIAVVGARADDPAGGNSGSTVIYRYSPSADMWTIEHELRGWDVASSDFYGTSVAASGHGVSVGCPRWDFFGEDAGAAFFYRPSHGDNNDQWQHDGRVIRPCIPAEQKIENAAQSSDYPSFGRSIAVNGNAAIAGDPYALNGGATPIGSVQFMSRSSASAEWVAASSKNFSLPAGLDDWEFFGHSVAIDGDLALVGGREHGSGVGHAWVYRLVEGVWAPVQELAPTGAHSGFGSDVAITRGGGDAYFVVGAPGAISDHFYSGQVYVYRWDDFDAWADHILTVSEHGFASGTSSFGASLDVEYQSNGTLRLAVGNRWYGGGGPGSGCVDVYSVFPFWVGWDSLFQARMQPYSDAGDACEGSFAAHDIDLSGDFIIAGMREASYSVGYRSGMAALYEGADDGNGGITWVFNQLLVPPDGGNDNFAGWSVAIDDAGYAVLGTPGSDYAAENAGVVYPFHPDSAGDWIYAGTLISSEPAGDDGLGVSVALDGFTLMAGAPGMNITELAGDRPNALAWTLTDQAFYQDWESGSMGSDNAWSPTIGGVGNGLFSLLLANPYRVPFDISEWIGSIQVMLDHVTLRLLGETRTITGSMDIAGLTSLKNATLGIDSGTLLVQGDMTVGRPDEAGQLKLSSTAYLEVMNTLSLHSTAGVSIEVTHTETASRINAVMQQPSIGGAMRVEFGPNDLPEMFTEGDRFVLMSSGVAPTGGFDVIVLPGLTSGLAFQVNVGPPGERSQGGCGSGEIEDCFGNCCPSVWVGDGLCDDGSYQWNGVDIYLNCNAHGCDGGDCGADCWDEAGAWEMSIEVISIAGLLNFGNPESATVAGDPTGIEVVDLTGDSAEEICVTLAGAPGNLVIFENDGTGGVSQQIVIPTGDEPLDVSSGDFDGDGRNDLVVANYLSQDVTIFYNDDNDVTNGFVEVDLNVDGPPTCLSGINANFDLYDDLVVGLDDTDGDGNGYYAIYLGVTPLRSLPDGPVSGGGIAPSGTPLGVDPSEDEDQKDFLFGGRQSDGKTATVKGSGVLSGITLSITEYVTGADPGGLTIGDLNGDDRGDICVTSTTNGTIAILLQDVSSPGDFLPPIFVPVGDEPTRITSIDFDNDGNLDLAAIVQEVNPITGLDEPVVRVLQGNGSLGFTSIETAWGENTALVASGDVSGDGIKELITIGGGASFRGLSPLLTLRAPTACPGDFDGTGDVGIDDLLVLLGEFAECATACQSDLDDDGDVDIDDMLALIGAWGPCSR